MPAEREVLVLVQDVLVFLLGAELLDERQVRLVGVRRIHVDWWAEIRDMYKLTQGVELIYYNGEPLWKLVLSWNEKSVFQNHMRRCYMPPSEYR